MAIPTITRPSPPPTDVAPTRPAVRPPMHKQRAPAHHWGVRGALVALEGVVALTAIQGAIFVVPTLPREWLRQGALNAFDDYTIPALTLGIVCGGSALLALVAVAIRPWVGAITSIAAGVLMVGYELVEIAVVGFTPARYPTLLPAWLQVIYLALGTMIAVLGGYLLWELARSFRLFALNASTDTP